MRTHERILAFVAFAVSAIAEPDDVWLSPLIESVDFVEYPLQNPPLADGDWICGPILAWKRAGDFRGSAVVYGNGDTLGVPVGFHGQSLSEAKPPKTRQLPNGTWLILDIPQEFFAKQSTTMCFASPWGKIAVYSLVPATGKVQVAFLGRGRMCGIEDVDAEISADWSTITFYENAADGWTATRHCLSGAEGVYKPCAVGGKPTSVAEAPKRGLFGPR